MLRVNQCRNAAAAKGYYSKADYYSGDQQEMIGLWGGLGAERLKLFGRVDKRSADMLCDNLDPNTGQRLTCRMRKDRTPGYDLNFHVCKSASILYAMTEDPAILAAFREAVNATMKDLEAGMQTRVRKKGQMTDRTVGNMVWAEYIHFTSRPVDGVPDPHLHAHCFVYNTVYDPEERRWKAGKFRDLKEDAPRFQKEFQKRFAERLVRLGYPIAWKGENFEIAGVDRAMIDRFSRRTIRINELARQQGLTSPRLKDQLGAKTREHKRNSIPLPRLRELWGRRLTPRDEGVLAIATARRRFTTVGVDGSYRPYGSLSRSQYDVATSRSAVRRVPASSLPPGLAERQRRTGLKLYRGEECDEPPPVAAMVIPFPSPGHGR